MTKVPPVEKYYKIVYKDRAKDQEPPYEYDYVEIEDYVEPTKEELLKIISSFYNDVSLMLLSQRTYGITNVTYEILSHHKNEIDSSNITSDLIRWHQRPVVQKIPESEVQSRKDFINKLTHRGASYNGLV
jgi:hypothetical protein